MQIVSAHSNMVTARQARKCFFRNGELCTPPPPHTHTHTHTHTCSTRAHTHVRTHLCSTGTRVHHKSHHQCSASRIHLARCSLADAGASVSCSARRGCAQWTCNFGLKQSMSAWAPRPLQGWLSRVSVNTGTQFFQRCVLHVRACVCLHRGVLDQTTGLGAAESKSFN